MEGVAFRFDSRINRPQIIPAGGDLGGLARRSDGGVGWHPGGGAADLVCLEPTAALQNARLPQYHIY